MDASGTETLKNKFIRGTALTTRPILVPLHDTSNHLSRSGEDLFAYFYSNSSPDGLKSLMHLLSAYSSALGLEGLPVENEPCYNSVMNISKSLQEIGLHTENCVVIGSSILSAYGIRGTDDIDVVTDSETYDRLASNVRFDEAEDHGREVLTDELFEIGTSWGVLDKDQTLDDLTEHSTVIDGVRYVTITFLLAVKKSWLLDEEVRQKDIDDVKLIEDYLAQQLVIDVNI